ncbi:MAG: ORF6N domain-containing protein [Elusimicrobiota bacterium]|jgi:hypothetical protein
MDKDIEAVDLGQKIYLIRGQKVMLDHDLAALYGVPTKRLNEQVRRNRERFPEDFMFQLTIEEARIWTVSRSQNATLKRGKNIKHFPYAFTEHGAVMLASVLSSPIAVRASIQVVRAFVRLRDTLSLHKELAAQLRELERKVVGHDARIAEIFAVIKRLMAEPRKAAPRIGFKPD